MADEVQQTIESLKEAIKNLAESDGKLQDDLYLLQWLKARKMNVKQTETSIRASVKWRKEKNVDALASEEFPEPLVQGSPFFWDFKSKTGAPVCFVREDDMGLAGLLRLYGKDTVVRYITLQYLKIEKIMIEYNRKQHEGKENITLESTVGFTAIFNGEGYGLRHVSSFGVLQLYFEIAQIYQKYFPAIANIGYFINANTFAMVSYRFIKPLLEGPHITIKFFGTDKSTWEKLVFDIIDPDVFLQLQERIQRRNEGYKTNPIEVPK